MTYEESTRKMAELYDEGLSLDKIGKRFGMTRQGVRERFIKAGIIRRQPKPIDKARLESLYSKDRIPISEIAAIFEVSIGRIEKTLRSYKIPRRLPLKKGGYIVDFLRNLNVGETSVFTYCNDTTKCVNLHYTAKLVGIKIFTRSCGDNQYKVTRLE